MVFDNSNLRWVFTHVLADKFNLENGVYSAEQGCYKHHVDFNKLNNNPDNIIRMTKDDHLKLHSDMADRTIHREDIKQKAREAHKSPEYRQKIREIMSKP